MARCEPCGRDFASHRGLASHNGRVHPSTEATERRWNKAIDRILNSGLLHCYMDDFWRYVDGEITYDEFSDRMSP